MDQKKFCFIICANQDRYVEECLHYLGHLEVPEGYGIDILTIADAPSMTAGYNEGMKASDAKYKIYLHQDVFIINRHFLGDILQVFKDPKIGLLGLVGTVKLPDHGMMWKGDRVGRVCVNDVVRSEEANFGSDRLCQVEAVDGLLMATQYDLEWRSDIFQGWDFYDVSQSLEFARQGYRVVVPRMEKPWAIHDNGILDLSNYHSERKKMLQEYASSMRAARRTG